MGRDGRERLLARGLNPNRVFITPPSVDVDRFVPAPDDAPRPYDVVTVGELIPTKQLDDFVRIVQLLRRRRPTLSAAVAGDGPLREQIRRAAERHGVAQTIDFLGPRTDIEHVYRSGRVFVLTSRHEGLSVAMSEAMASGLPVVVTNVGDLSDLVQDGRNGFLLPVGDVEGFAERIESLLQDRVAYDAFGRAARAAVIVHASVSRLTDVYREILVSSE
jgi:glycosyltransferase involved in cell wall biosynthesis